MKNRKIDRPGVRGLTAQNETGKMYRHRSFGFGAILFPRNEPKCVKLLENRSFRTFYDSMQLSDYRISCVGTALKLYDQLGEEIYCEALRHIVEAWEGRPDSFRAAVLRGVMYFVQLYHGQYSAERLVRALSGVHPMELYDLCKLRDRHHTPQIKTARRAAKNPQTS